jgi:hypothetical protein
MPRRVVPDEKIPDDVRKRVVELYKAGVKTADITTETGVVRSSIYWILQQAGVRPERQTTGTQEPLEGSALTLASIDATLKRIEQLLERLTEAE